MNGMLATYESTLIESFGQGRQSKQKNKLSMNRKDEQDHYMIFDAVQNADIRTELENLPAKMANPFINMRRWLKFELLDLRAILMAIEKKNEMDDRRIKKIRARDTDRQ